MGHSTMDDARIFGHISSFCYANNSGSLFSNLRYFLQNKLMIFWKMSSAFATIQRLKLNPRQLVHSTGIPLVLQPMSQLKLFVDQLRSRDLISANDAEQLKLSMNGDQGVKFVRALHNNGQEISSFFTISGFISLRISDREVDPPGLLLYAFGMFYFNFKFGKIL